MLGGAIVWLSGTGWDLSSFKDPSFRPEQAGHNGPPLQIISRSTAPQRPRPPTRRSEGPPGPSDKRPHHTSQRRTPAGATEPPADHGARNDNEENGAIYD